MCVTEGQFRLRTQSHDQALEGNLNPTQAATLNCVFLVSRPFQNCATSTHKSTTSPHCSSSSCWRVDITTQPHIGKQPDVGLKFFLMKNGFYSHGDIGEKEGKELKIFRKRIFLHVLLVLPQECFLLLLFSWRLWLWGNGPAWVSLPELSRLLKNVLPKMKKILENYINYMVM